MGEIELKISFVDFSHPQTHSLEMLCGRLTISDDRKENSKKTSHEI
jgi:hypothetical protein